MIKKSILLFTCISLLACTDKKETLPENVLPVKKMAEVQTDIHLLEAALSQDMKLVNIPAEKNAIHILKIFEKHKITKEQYVLSKEYYETHLDSLSEIYEQVLIELSKMPPEKDTVIVTDSLASQQLFRERMMKR